MKIKLLAMASAIKHPAASYGVLTALFKLLALASLRPKERGIKPEEIKPKNRSCLYTNRLQVRQAMALATLRGVTQWVNRN